MISITNTPSAPRQYSKLRPNSAPATVSSTKLSISTTANAVIWPTSAVVLKRRRKKLPTAWKYRLASTIPI